MSSRKSKVRPGYLLLGPLVLLMAVLMAPALRALVSPEALHARQALVARLQAVQAQARTDGCAYSVVLEPNTGQIWVMRWSATGSRARPEDVPALSGPLPDGARIERTTLPGDTLTISDSGFPLTRGRIYLRAADGSRESLAVGGEQ